MKKISKLILRLAGWTIVTTVPEPPKSVICVAPHTSNWDYIMGQLYYWAEGRKASFLIKKQWFFFPLGALFRRLGGIAVDSANGAKVVKTVVDEFNRRTTFHVAITPEGTRQPVKRWKMGFYNIAMEAKAPVQLAFIDYKQKRLGITDLLTPSGDVKADMQRIYDFYNGVAACKPQRFCLPEI